MALVGAVAFASCTRSNGSISMGSKSEFDSLSYALGNNVASGLQGSDVPFDFDAMAKGVNEGALGTAKMTPEEALEMAQTYFMTTRPERAQAAAKAQAELPDSLRSTPSEAAAGMFADDKERADISYAFGVDFGSNMFKADLPIQLIWFDAGLKDVIAGGETRMDKQQVDSFLQHYFTVVAPERNKKTNEEWLASIEKESGVQKTESGLLYKIEEMGDQTVMAKDPRDRVKVHYKGTNHKGEAFDSSYYEFKSEEMKKMLKEMNPEGYAEDKPLELSLDGVIRGWTEGLMLVGKGGKITLWIPSDLAYGERGGRSRQIPANEALKFEVEMVDVIPYVEPDSLQTLPAGAVVVPATTVKAIRPATVKPVTK